MSKGVLQKDGTYCYSGATCKKHGTKNQVTQLNQKIDSLFTKQETNWRKPLKNIYKNIAKKYYLEDLESTQKALEETGLKQTLTLPDWNENALNADLAELKIDNNTSLLIQKSYGLHERRRITVWMVEKGQTVSMLQFLISPDKKSQKYWGEAVIGSIEVKPGEQGKGYAMKTIKTVENHLINQKIHSGGHYTPEGEKALRGKLPFTKRALEEQKESEIFEHRKGIGVHFKSMTFIEDWDSFWIK